MYSFNDKIIIPLNKSKLLILLVFFGFSACGGPTDPYAAFEAGDYETAYKLLKPLADQGDTKAQNHLGVHYFLGLGVAKDQRKAVEWYEKAAKQGDPDAQRNLGDMYMNGHGVQKDDFKAYMWYFAAVQQGNESAQARIDILAGLGNISPNKQMHAKIEANEYILDPENRFMSHDTYVDKDKRSQQ